MKTIGKTLIAMIVALSFIGSTLAANVSKPATKVKQGVVVAAADKKKCKSHKNPTTPKKENPAASVYK